MQDVARDYITKGWAVVPVTKGKKKASSSFNKKNYSPDNFETDDNIAGKCGEPSGWLIDVDCDAPEAVEAARLLLPHTGLVHGRPGKPDSHYWYRCDGIKTKQFTDVKDASGESQMIVEIRSTGGYTVIPPSLWTNKEGKDEQYIAWSIERDPLSMSPDDLHDAVRAVALAAICARHWPNSGGRHAMVGHLAGFLLQGKIDPVMVVQIIKAAATIAKDPDIDDRVKFASGTCAKFKDGQPISGGPKLAEELGADTVAKMRAWLRLADADGIDDMNTRHFWVRLGKDDCIGREDASSGVIFQKVRSLYSEYANQKIQTGVDKNGDPVFKPVFQEWLESKTRRTYREVIFAPPPRAADPRDFNLWRGFAVDAVPGKCDRFLDHLYDVICSGDDEHYKYLTKLCAYTLQFPGLPSEVATVLRGEPGTGKGTFIRVFQQIFGRHHFAHLDRVEDLVQFNSLISGKVIVFADEAFWAGDKREIGTLKRLITEPTIRVTRKGIDSVEEANCIHLFMATNEEWSVPAQLRERRFFALNVSNKHRRNTAYFGAIEKEFREGGIAAFMHEMMQVPVTKEDIINVPITKELRIQQNQSMALELRWWQECLHDGRCGQVVPWGTWVPVMVIYEAYRTWAREHTNRVLDKIEFGRRLSNLISPEKPKSKRINGDVERATNVYALDEARRAFDKACESETEWPDVTLHSTQGAMPF